jgi:O-antigen/teichoic acid export membrane protein
MILMFVAFFSAVSHAERFTLIMLAGLAGNILMTALTWWYANRYQRVKFAWDIDYIRHIIRISLPYGLALFLNVIFFKVDTILLSVMSPKYIADTVVALYALPMKIVEVGMMYGTIFLNSLLPVLTQAFEQKDREKIWNLTAKAWKILLFFGVGIAISGYALAPEIIRLISSSEYIHTRVSGSTSVEAMQIVVWIFLFYFISSLFTYTLIARSEQRKMLTINTIIAIINIV